MTNFSTNPAVPHNSDRVDAFQALESLLKIKRQWNGREKGGLTVEIALKALNRIACDCAYPEVLRSNAVQLQMDIIRCKRKPKRTVIKKVTPKQKELI